MSDSFDKGIRKTNQFFNSVQNGEKAVSRAANTVNELIYPNGNNSQPASATTAQPAPTLPQGSGSVLSSQTTIENGKKYYTTPAPKGTRLIIPAHISSTGQERYISANVLESIINHHQGNPRCANAVIMDANNKPSSTFYDILQDGSLSIKGTTTKIEFSSDNPPVPLSETEYITIIQSLNQKPNDVTYFKTTADKGEAETSTASSPNWFSRNWWRILLGLVIAGGIVWGGIAYKNHVNDKEEKKQRAAANLASNTQEKVATAALETSTQTQSQGLSSAQNITNQTGETSFLQNSSSNSL